MGKGKNKSLKGRLGSVRARAGLVAKAGNRRPPHIYSERDRKGKRHWFPAPTKAK